MSSPRRILAVDDDALFLTLLHDHLSAGGFEFEGLSDAAQVVPRAAAFMPDLILIDRLMPVLSGIEVIRSLRSFPATAAIPVALITSDCPERELVRALRNGAIDVIQKPFLAEHVDRVNGVIDEVAARRPVQVANAADLAARNLLSVYRRDGRSGTLLLNPGTPFEGIARFRKGNLESADFGPVHGIEALGEMFQVEDGVWRFEASDGKPARAAVAQPTREVAPPFKPRLLVVDDDPELRRLFRSQLARAGYDVEVAEDGQRGVEAVRRSAFDLIIADLNMPQLDGWGMLRMLKADLRSREVPLVFLSAHDDYRETLRAARSGAHDYLAKTGRAEDVVERAEALIAPRRVAWSALGEGKGFPIHSGALGVQWLLRAVGRLGATGAIHLNDDWARYTVWFRDGAPLDARAIWPKRQATGLPAVAALLVARGAEGAFEPGPVEGEARLFMTMEALLTRTIALINDLDERVTLNRLSATQTFAVDETLYELYRQIGPERGVALARAVCEDRVGPTQLSSRLAFPADEIQEGLRELLRRGVIAFQEH